MAGIRAARKTGKPRATAPRGNRLAGWSQLNAGAEKKGEGARPPPARGACTPVGAAGAPPTTALPVRGLWRNGETVCRSPTRATRAKNANSHDNRRAMMKPQSDSARECSASSHIIRLDQTDDDRGAGTRRRDPRPSRTTPHTGKSDGAPPQTCRREKAENAARDIVSMVCGGVSGSRQKMRRRLGGLPKSGRTPLSL